MGIIVKRGVEGRVGRNRGASGIIFSVQGLSRIDADRWV